MQITISVIESNARKDGLAIINGVHANVTDAHLTGSEKQIAWAEKIIADVFAEAAQIRLKKIANGGLCKAAELDALVATLNSQLVAIAAKLDGTSAAKWIDNRNLGVSAPNAVLKG